jgi:hypothetical protein
MKGAGRSTIAGLIFQRAWVFPTASAKRALGPPSESDPMKHLNGNTKGVLVKVPEILFNPGAVFMTPGVRELIEGEKLELKEVCSFLARHLSGDWGELDGHDRRRNEDALREGSRLFSAYRSTAGDKLWVITEAVSDGGFRASTTVLLPDEY